MKEKTRQVIYFQRPNVLSLSASLDATRILNIGKTTYDSEDELKRMYPINADKLDTTAWTLFDSFEIKEAFEKLANKFYETKNLDMDQPFHNYIKANSIDWVWVDPKEYKEINRSPEIFRYIGPKPMETAIEDLIKELKEYQGNVIKGKADFYANKYNDYKKTICSREMIEKIAKLTVFLVSHSIINPKNKSVQVITSENEADNDLDIKSIWYNKLYELSATHIKLCIDIIKGDIYLYVKYEINSNDSINKIYKRLDNEYENKYQDGKGTVNGIAYFLIGNLISDSSENNVEEIAEKIQDLLDDIKKI
jgi:hypothetical protein